MLVLSAKDQVDWRSHTAGTVTRNRTMMAAAAGSEVGNEEKEPSPANSKDGGREEDGDVAAIDIPMSTAANKKVAASNGADVSPGEMLARLNLNDQNDSGHGANDAIVLVGKRFLAEQCVLVAIALNL